MPAPSVIEDGDFVGSFVFESLFTLFFVFAFVLPTLLFMYLLFVDKLFRLQPVILWLTLKCSIPLHALHILAFFLSFVLKYWFKYLAESSFYLVTSDKYFIAVIVVLISLHCLHILNLSLIMENSYLLY